MSDDPASVDLTRRHLRIGWWGLLVFLTVGLALGALHCFKAGLYLDVTSEPRRLMWHLAHAHGTLLSLVHLGFAQSLGLLPGFTAATRTLASRCLLGALLLMPLGFLLGGLWIHSGDPGLGVFLVPPGGLLLLIGVLLTARAASRRS